MEGENNPTQVPPAQEPQGAGEQTQTQAGQAGQTESNAGIQKRFDELTAKLYEKEAQVQALTASFTEAMAKFAAQPQQTQQQPQATDPFSDVDWSNADSVRGSFMQALQQQSQRLEQKFSQQLAQVQVQTIGGEVMSVAAQFNVTDTAIIQRAQALASSWRQQGLPFPVADAMRFAIGEAATGSLPQARRTNGQFAPVNPVMTQQGMPVQTRSAPVNGALPANFEALSPDQQIAILEQRMGNKPW